MAAAMIVVGSLLVSVGAGLVYLPAGLIVAGAFLLWCGVDAARDVLPEGARRGSAKRLRAVGDDQ